MNIAVTGSAGFIGSHLVPMLHSHKHSVYQLSDNANCGLPYGLDVCIHLAWRGYAGSGGADENISSLHFGLETLKTLRRIGCKRFVGIGTCFEYAPSSSRLSEHNPLAASGTNPFYSRCKLVFSEVSQHYCDAVGMEWAWARIFNCYGPREHASRLVPTLIRGALNGKDVLLSGGDQMRDYLHVSDVASALALIATSDATGAINVCSGQGVTVRALAMLTLNGRAQPLFGALPYRDGDPMRMIGDPMRLHQLGWQPQIPLHRGLEDCEDYWRASLASVGPSSCS